MPVLTISREFGSQGSFIAEQAAQALGYHYVTKQTLGTILNQYGLVGFQREYETAPGFWDRFDTQRLEIVEMLNRVSRSLARHGNVVILGRGSFAILAGLAGVLHARIQAPLALRVERVMARDAIADHASALALVKETDRVRAAFIESFYGVHWNDARLFDVVIDTGKISPSLATDWLVAAMRALPPAAAAEASAALPADPVLDSVVAGELNTGFKRIERGG